jgi:rod shape-determining protein MreB
MGLFNFFRQELAIDLGTANTLIIMDGQIVVDEPSIVAVDRKTGNVIAVGNRAMQMHEKTHDNIKTIRPLKDGVIADFQAAENMIEGLIKMAGAKKRFFSHLKMVICIPSGITEVEKRAVFESADHVDSKETYLIHEPMAGSPGYRPGCGRAHRKYDHRYRRRNNRNRRHRLIRHRMRPVYPHRR